MKTSPTASRCSYLVFIGVLLAMVTFSCTPASTDDPATSSGESEADSAAGDSRPALDLDAIAAAAVNDAGRSDADRQDDANRKPAEVLAFFGIEPGMTVLDLLAGGGYYTEILSRIVGDDGKVMALNNSAYLGFVGEDYDKRLTDGRLPNVERIDSEVLDWEPEAGTVDAAIFVLGYHDIYYRPEDGGWEELTPEIVLGKLYTALRPGGVLGIVDHAAIAGADVDETANTLHRIDEAVVQQQIEAAGFTLEATSDVLRHPEDEHTLGVFDDAIRRRTDRFVHRYRKPA